MKTSSRMKAISKTLILLLSLSILIPSQGFAARVQKEKPTGYTMVGDALIARPFLILGTVAGAGLFLVTLPFSLLGSNVGDSGKTLVVSPAKAAFLRCLGCTPVQNERNRLNKRYKKSS